METLIALIFNKRNQLDLLLRKTLLVTLKEQAMQVQVSMSRIRKKS